MSSRDRSDGVAILIDYCLDCFVLRRYVGVLAMTLQNEL